jgi:hypothetical protein
MKATVLLAAALALTACSTTQIRENQAAAVPTERITQQELASPSSERTAKVSFTRDRGFLGGACAHRVSIDGRLAFSLRPGETQTIYLAPGQHFFGLESGGGLCPGTSESQTTNLGPTDEQAFRIMVSASSGQRLSRIK